MTSWRALLVVCVVSVLLAPARSAGAAIQVNPSIVRPVVRPGAAQEFRIFVTTDEPSARQARVEVANMTMAPQGFPVPAAADDPRGCAAWMSVSPESFTLLPGRTYEVTVRLQAPRQAAGGYYALISVKVDPARRLTLEGRVAAGIQATQSMGVAVLVVVPGRGLTARLRPGEIRLSPSSGQAGRGSWELEATVGNQGNIHAQAQGVGELRTAEGRLIARVPLDGGKGTVLPGAFRRYVARGREHLADGVYIVTARFHIPGTRSGAMLSQAFMVRGGQATPVDPGGDLRALIEGLAPALSISPVEVELAAPRGSRRAVPLDVRNLSREPLDVELSVGEWQLSRSGEDEFPSDAPEHGRSAAAWLSVAPARATLRPGGRVTVRLTAVVPAGAAPGDYMAAIRLRRGPRVLDPAYAVVRVSVPPQPKPVCGIADLEVKGVNTPQAVASVTVANESACAIWPTVTFSLTDAGGRAALPPSRLAGGELVVLPGQKRQFTLPLDLVLRPGRYTATAVATAQEGEDAVSKTVSFSAGQWRGQ